jgi:hypothetical protein
MRVESGQVQNVNVSNIVKRKTDEEKRLREMTIPKKQKRLYDQIKFTQKKKRQEVSFSQKNIFFFSISIYLG